MAELQCIVVTPEQTVRETPADFVAVTLFDGEIGIAPGHTPLIGGLGYGELRIRHGKEVERFYVEGGFVEVLSDAVSLLTNRAIPRTRSTSRPPLSLWKPPAISRPARRNSWPPASRPWPKGGPSYGGAEGRRLRAFENLQNLGSRFDNTWRS